MEVMTKYDRVSGRVIPKDWEIKTLGIVVDKIVGGGTPRRSNKQYWGREIPWVTVKDFATFNPYSTQEYITKVGLENSASNLIPKNTLITSTRMGLGKAVIFKVDVSINQDLKALFPSKLVTTEFLFHWFKNNFEVIEKLGNGSTVMGISLNELKGIPFILPPIKEQTAIATALFDADALINSMEKLIAKKRNIKQGAMQELLKPKKGWEIKHIIDVADKIIDYRGVTPKKLGMEWGGGNILALSANNVQMGYIDYTKDCYLGSEQLYKQWMRNGDCCKDDILMTMEAPLGNIASIPDDRKYILSQRTILIRPKDVIDKIFMRYIMMDTVFQQKLIESASGTTALGIQRKKLEKLKIEFPKDKEEQRAIAMVLSDLDYEIRTLLLKLEKYRQIKAGMMQNLLTGKIRLV